MQKVSHSIARNIYNIRIYIRKQTLLVIRQGATLSDRNVFFINVRQFFSALNSQFQKGLLNIHSQNWQAVKQARVVQIGHL